MSDNSPTLAPGERWKIITGDCLEVMRGMAAESVPMIFTDPPYGHSNADGDFLSARHAIMRDGNHTPQEAIENDDHEGMRRVVDGMLQEAARILCRDCCCCCCCCCGGGPRPTFAWIAQRMDTHEMAFFHSVIWDKLNPGIGWKYRRQHEMVMVAHRAGGSLAWSDPARQQPNIIRLGKPRDGNHPNEKPVELVSLFIVNHTLPDDIILDPFAGSGTTGVAALRTGRRFIGIEIDEKYASIARRRCAEAAEAFALFEPPVREQQGTLIEPSKDKP